MILTYSWDRLLIDPAPGPRSPRDFTGLRPLTPSVQAVPAGAAPVAPAGSTLPRLADVLPQTFALIDPRHGVLGMTRQLEELIAHLAPETIDLLDVGGDILARGDEPTLRSPLADALTLAACARLDAPVRLLVAGPGLDGELPPQQLRDRLGPLVLTLTPETVLHHLTRFETEARTRGITHTTFRRLTEALGFNVAQRPHLRDLLLATRPEQYEAPLWRITPGT
ncbi:hypothetical protein GCM10027091_43760 [Streptomyces daliensis]